MLSLLVMTALLGAASFGCGLIPLSFGFSKSHLSQLTTLGSGLLLGTALGVIIPEGIEALDEAYPASEISGSQIAVSLLCGFTFMLLIERLLTPHSHSTTSIPLSNVVKPSRLSEVEFDAGLAGEQEGYPGNRSNVKTSPTESSTNGEMGAIPLTLGLVIHSLADGFALGVSFFSASTESEDTSLSVIVFLAIIIHKLPTSLALTSSLLATSLSRSQCKRHLIAFSVSTPISAIITYIVLDFFGGSDQHADWPGIALLLSGGTFLNVATLVSHHSDAKSSEEMSHKAHMFLTVLGIFIPFTLSSILGHGH
ncbi:hypothetical protein GYMLUDRAFT_34101 [Collybiopsis luxurians FD-317 M1]|nr:hypothetical protein GYMLUDRAFT_34101 [Collybiopsis luxurians FD-317 M1]